MLSVAAEYVCHTRKSDLAARIEPLLLEKEGSVISWGASGLCIDAPIARCLALCAIARRELDLAIERFQAALVIAETTGARPHQAWIRRELAAVLRERGAPSDVARAEALAREANALAETLGITWGEGASREGAQASARPNTSAPSPKSLRPDETFDITLERRGELWALICGEKTLHLEDTKGLRYLAQLLAQPRHSFHVLELSGVDPSEVDRGSSGELLDRLAVQRYKARIAELRDELEEEPTGERADKLREELEALEEELVKGLGLGGRARRAQNSQVERARINVQRRIRDALTRIEAHAPEVAKKLERAIKTGVFCVYDP